MGREAKIETLKWNRFKGIAEITYRVNQLFLDVIESKDTPDGE
jgi:hypothetical protein